MKNSAQERTSTNNRNTYKAKIRMLSETIAETLYDPTVNSMNKADSKSNLIDRTEDKYYILKNNLTIEPASNNEITFDQIYSFFANSPQNKGNIDLNYMQQLFNLMNLNASECLTIEEFIFAYITLEEKLQIKLAKIYMLYEDMKEAKVKYTEQREHTKEEVLNKNGVNTNASLSLTLFEAKDLKVESPMSNVFIVLSLNGVKQKSSMVNSQQPWDEDFAYPVANKNDELLIEVYGKMKDKSQLIGSVKISLFLFDHQLMTENWYQLISDTSKDCGSIRMKLHLLYDLNKYYADQVEKTETQINRLIKDITELEDYKKLCDIPFGVIYEGGITSIIEKRMFQKSEDILEYEHTLRQSVYIPTKESLVHKEPITLDVKVGEWSLITKILFGVSVLLCCLSFLTRADYPNLLVLVLAFCLLMDQTQANNDLLIKPVMYSLIGMMIYDLMWIVIHFADFKIDVYYNNWVYLFTLILGIVNCVIKAILAYFIFARRDQTNELKKQEIDKIMNTKIRFH